MTRKHLSTLNTTTPFFYKHQAYKHDEAQIFWENNGKNNGLLFENKRKLSMIGSSAKFT